MKRIIAFVFVMILCMVMSATPQKYGKCINFDRCYEWEHSVESWKKDKYPDFSKIQLYSDDGHFIMKVMKKDKSGNLYLLEKQDFEKMSKVTPISSKESFLFSSKSYKEKIKNRDIRTLKSNAKDNSQIYMSGYKKRYVKIQFDDDHFYILKYSKFLKILEK